MASPTDTPAPGTDAPTLYKTDYRKVLAQTADYFVAEYRVSPGQESPWHFHTATTGLFYVLSGRLDVLLADPMETVVLHAGQSWQIPSGRVHRFRAGEDGGANYLLLQGVGKPDFVRVDR